ncbi:MAG: hypothetical protein ACYCR9_03440 [Cuniculiplasma sp.]
MVLARVLSPSWFDKEFSPKNHNNACKKDAKNRDKNKPNIKSCPRGDTNGNKE